MNKIYMIMLHINMYNDVNNASKTENVRFKFGVCSMIYNIVNFRDSCIQCFKNTPSTRVFAVFVSQYHPHLSIYLLSIVTSLK